MSVAKDRVGNITIMASQIASFPLTFLSNVFVDPETMPEFMQRIVNLNPVSLTATAVRGLMEGNATSISLGMCSRHVPPSS